VPEDLELGPLDLDQLTMLTVAAIADQRHATLQETVGELVREGIAARTQRTRREHRCRPGEINRRFCGICSKPIR
jgi:hypothetical protein